MNVTRLAVAFGLSILAASTSFVACSGDDSSPSKPRTDAGLDSTVDNDSGSETDARTERDARASDPGELVCGNQVCNTDEQYCCLVDGGATCNSPEAGACRGIEVGCDEQPDCDTEGGDVCCGTAKGGDVSAECKPASQCSNPFESRRICKTNAECGDADKCVTQPCKGIIISTCGGIPPSACAN
ncbi:hypothetical protein LVJ94_12680 [Pendulispora rubella]|uniref:Tryptophan synthase alpha chain n=1 Tax=Pendulispora rubella TaxID=2741070 RepID=A0ABZ2LEU6_9BACT